MRACVPGVKPGMAAVGLLLFTVMGDPPPLRGTTVNEYLVYVTLGGGMAVAVPAVGLVACTLVSVGAAAGEVVNVSGAEAGLVVPGLTATTCTSSNGVSLATPAGLDRNCTPYLRSSGRQPANQQPDEADSQLLAGL